MKTENHLFAVRSPLAAELEQLLQTVQLTPLWQQVRGSCFVMAEFVASALRGKGHATQLLPCHAVASNGNAGFRLGQKGILANTSQVDGHVVVLVDNKAIVDFGLWNVHRYGWPEFEIAAACALPPASRFPQTLALGGGRAITWRDDWFNPDTLKIAHNHGPVARLLLDQCGRMWCE